MRVTSPERLPLARPLPVRDDRLAGHKAADALLIADGSRPSKWQAACQLTR